MKLVTEKVLEEIRENQRRLAAFPGPHFFTTDYTKPTERLFVCRVCCGLVSEEIAQWYRRGLERKP